MTTNINTKLRKHVFKRDDYTCRGCGFHDPSALTLHFDHVKAQKNGGLDTKRNGQTLCEACNKAKGGLDHRFTRKVRPNADVTNAEFMVMVAYNRRDVVELMNQKRLIIKIKKHGKTSPETLKLIKNQEKYTRHKERNKIGEV